MPKEQSLRALQNWRALMKKYQQPNAQKALIQLLNTFLPFLGIWVLMYYSLNWPYLITLALSVINGFFLVRIFVIQHDCGHHSFIPSRRVNNVIGFFASCFSTIPFASWSRMHNFHHAHNGQIEHRGMGDIFFLTTDEYLQRSQFGKWRYQFYRSTFLQFILAPIIYLTLTMRFPAVRLPGWKKVRWSHLINNVLLVFIFFLLGSLLGWKKFLLVHVPILYFFGVIAFWFFYVQHQHEDSYKETKDSWNFLEASIHGSTYYKLPKLFQWLSGSIGFHHIHHLNSRIPNYHLARCARENPLLNKFVTTLTFRESLVCLQHKLWCPQQKRMISFREFRSRT